MQIRYPTEGGGATQVAWGTITGTLSSQTDLQAALNAKQAVAADIGIWLQSANSWGGGAGNIILRWSNIIGSNTLGSNATYVDDATNGGNITILQRGIWTMSFTVATGASAECGITVNASSLTAPGSSLAANERVAITDTQGSFLHASMSRTMVLQVNDVVRWYVTNTGNPGVGQDYAALVLVEPF